MPYNPEIHHRRSIRLPEYDYSQEGLYFVTICVHNRKLLFGKIIDDIMLLNDAGLMLEKWFNRLITSIAFGITQGKNKTQAKEKRANTPVRPYTTLYNGLRQ